MSSYEITAAWETNAGDTGWYFPLKVTIKNNTNQAVYTPEISFDLSKVQHIDTNQPINAYTGFTHQSNTFPVIKGTLADHLATLPANGSVTLTFGVGFNPVVPSSTSVES